MRTCFLWPVALFAATFSCSASAAEPFVTAKIVFQNPGPYAQADLEAAAGVHVGDKITLAGITAAAQRLVATQAFSKVTMDSRGAANALTLIFMLKPQPRDALVPLDFENMVWLTPAERKEVVHKSAPLGNGTLALGNGTPALGNGTPALGNGTLALGGGALVPGSSETDAIVAALQVALTAKGVVSPKVHVAEVLPTTASPVHSLQFRLESPAVNVDRFFLDEEEPDGGSPASSAAEKVAAEKVAARLHGTPYAEGFSEVATERLVLRPYLDAGYLDAKLVGSKVEVAPGAADVVGVTVHARVEPGAVYHVGTIAYVPTALVSEPVFTASAKIHAGDPASRKGLLETAAVIDTAYQRQGFVDEYVDTHAAADPGAHTVNYRLEVVPGEQYSLRSLTVDNLPPAARAQFNLVWSMKPGDLYNVEYVKGFLGNNTATRGLAGYVGTFQAASDPATRTVDLHLWFAEAAGRQ